MLWVIIVAAILGDSSRATAFVIGDYLYKTAGKSIPKLSKTEEEALNAGDTWLEQDIFTGKPNWERLANISTQFSAEEQSFIDNETQTLCSMLDEWEISQER